MRSCGGACETSIGGCEGCLCSSRLRVLHVYEAV